MFFRGLVVGKVDCCDYETAPDDVFRRHDNCGCSTIYENGRTRQDVWSKRTWEVPAISPQRAEPVRLTREQGREIEQRNLSQTTRFSNAQGVAVQERNLQYRGLTSDGGSGIIRTGGLLARREHNIGAFSSLEMPMQKKTVTDICKKYGIDTSGLIFKIQRDEGLVGKPYFGLTDYDNIGRIDLLPEAFSNEEQLVRTILHEHLHVLQLRKYGKEYCIANLDRMERQAYWFEDAMYLYLRKKVR